MASLVLFLVENAQTAGNYMVFKMYCKDYQTVIKKQGVKGIPPLSSLILLFIDRGLDAKRGMLRSGTGYLGRGSISLPSVSYAFWLLSKGRHQFAGGDLLSKPLRWGF